ncbi:hypothetical protein R3P38DRAFT_2910757 [Favolaschia claudopus]|uniref:Uncharacterized protein n=1 Tax=Favolaschia claudopus TaxID=2862362 RepID=A0AAW0CDF5_9AGAR
MFFRHLFFFAVFFVLFYLQVSAFTFAPITGPFVKGAQVPIRWTLDGFEPASGLELWFSSEGSSIKLQNIPPLSTSAVVPFPGSNGTFQALAGITVLATSNEVDLVAFSDFPTRTFSASILSGPTSRGQSSISSPSSSSPTAAAESVTPSKSSSLSLPGLLGMLAAVLVLVAIIVLASVCLYVQRRRRRRAEAALTDADTYPFKADDVEKHLAGRISPFHALTVSSPQRPSTASAPPPRGSSLAVPSRRYSPPLPPLPPLPPKVRASTTELKRQAYLNSQLQKLDVSDMTIRSSHSDAGSIIYGPISSLPSGGNTDAVASPPIPVSPEPPPNSRRTAFLEQQLQRLADPVQERRPSSGSLVFGPLSSVPSESTARPYDAPSRLTSPSTNSPIEFIRPVPLQTAMMTRAPLAPAPAPPPVLLHPLGARAPRSTVRYG